MLAILLLTLAANPAPSLPVPKFRTDYAAAVERVEGGERLTIYAGVPLPTRAESNAVRVDAIPGEPAGVYDCHRGADGKPKMKLRTGAITSAPVRKVAGHSHRCPVDGTIWTHADGDPSASHNCPTCGRRVLDKHDPNVAVPAPAPAKPKRISMSGRWYDQYPDGRVVECVT